MSKDRRSIVVTVDGQSSTGKSSLACALANRLGMNFLGSGSIYRLCAYFMLRGKDLEAIKELLTESLAFKSTQGDMSVWVQGEDLTAKINDAQVTKMASDIAKDVAVRTQLADLQKGFQSGLGLVAEGRDMGTVIFPRATLKLFLTADVAVRAKRRKVQLEQMGLSPDYDQLVMELKARDHQDETRAISPLVPAKDAVFVDTAAHWDENLEQMYQQVLMVLPKQVMPKEVVQIFDQVRQDSMRYAQLGNVSDYERWWKGCSEASSKKFQGEIIGASWLCPIYVRDFIPDPINAHLSILQNTSAVEQAMLSVFIATKPSYERLFYVAALCGQYAVLSNRLLALQDIVG
ncbi:(d)CMP kinase [Candidatus Comchoanobacter bicostacola]|uniref:Cytidylate kinase n=1 Tax=Candidatus Comchoanobacter bicostacola TaxID=2919598 RepID=A0ABY5DIF5_9GAMM|nr:(d)CMP kinase [Candidatus Comchoanobacter bicostacola]UTC24179.1 (d)CMP kinase [Candidatus Comchoanobacter bicostacola]